MISTQKIPFIIFATALLVTTATFGCESSERGSSKTPPPPLSITLPRKDSHRQLTDLRSPVGAFEDFITAAPPETRALEAKLLLDHLEREKDEDILAKGRALVAVLPKLRAIVRGKIKWLTPEQDELLRNLLITNYPWWPTMHTSYSYVEEWLGT